MSYNYSEFKKKKKDNFKPSMPPPDNPVPSGMIKDIKSMSELWKINKIYNPKINKSTINKQFLKWKKALELLIKFHS